MKLLAPEKCHTYALIIRIGYSSSDDDREACAEELWRRGRWLDKAQPGGEWWQGFTARKMAEGEP